MKKYLILPFLFLASLLTGCVEDINQTLKEVKAEPSVVLFEQQGGEKTVTITATGDWTITNIPEWVKVDKTSGNQGTTEVKLQVLSAYDNLSQEIYVVAGGATQTILVQQAAGELKPTTTKDFVENGTDGKTYMIEGVVKNIINTVYGNLYINDGTSEKDAYIYGMLDANGSEKNFLSLGIEQGDYIVVQGPRTTYKNDIEIVNATLIEIKVKALLGAKVNSYVVASEAANYGAAVTVKGDDLTFSSNVDWLKVKGTKGSGTDVEVLYSVEENKDAAPRKAEITLVSTKGSGDKKTESTFVINVKQLPATTAKKIAEVDYYSKEYVTVEGVVNAIAKSGLVIKDETGLVFIETTESAKIGATVTATGASEKKYARNKIVADKVVASSDVVDVVYPTATVINKDNSATVIKESPAKYGYYTVSGYVNTDKKILIDGASQVVTAIDPVKDVDLSSFSGKYVTACGFYVDNNSGKGEIQLVLVSVEETKEGAPKIFDLPKTSGSIAWNETDVKFQILADKDSEWKASLAEGTEGISLSAASGKGSKDITVKFAGLNRTYTAQEAVVTVTVGEESKTFKAKRSGLTLSLKLDGNPEDITLDGGDVKVAITADLYWKVSVACSDAKYTAVLSKEEGKGTDGFVITLPKNETGADLTYTITAVDDRTDWQEGFVAGKGAELKIVQPGAVKEEPITITLTVDGLPTSYPATEAVATLAGSEFKILNVANFGNGIQMKKNGSYLYNSTSIGKVKAIKLICQDGKTWYKDNLKVYVGNGANPGTELAITSSDTTGSVYEVSTEGCGFIKIANPSNYAVYLKQIEIEVAK